MRLYVRLSPYAQHVNIVKVSLMEPPVEQTQPILCPHCLRRSVYSFQRDEYSCPVGHGVVITVEQLADYFLDTRS
jgi:hypothetical protein